MAGHETASRAANPGNVGDVNEGTRGPTLRTLLIYADLMTPGFVW